MPHVTCARGRNPVPHSGLITCHLAPAFPLSFCLRWGVCREGGGEGSTSLTPAASPPSRARNTRPRPRYPNADFVPVYTEDKFLILKAYRKCGENVKFTKVNGGTEGKTQPDRQLGDNSLAYAKYAPASPSPPHLSLFLSPPSLLLRHSCWLCSLPCALPPPRTAERCSTADVPCGRTVGLDFNKRRGRGEDVSLWWSF